MEWLKKLFNTNKEEAIVDKFNSEMADIWKAGLVNDEHYTDCVEEVKRLKREGKNQEAIEVLLCAVEATESESKFAGESWGVAPWYYEQLAILYRKEKLYHKEVEILERYSRQPKAPGAGPQKLATRLVKAKEVLAKNGV